ncbi:MAG: isoleucine--tRNA ligase [Chloroflexi bacterium]|nr:isoleucine--tRNA ligase [Chloroflexota bacterium]
MPFKEVSTKVDFPAQEREILSFWQETQAFEKMRELHKGEPPWSFIDGPITANNPMGVHHGWGRTYKDLYNRYWTMKGHELRYQNGFDCQGLWVEVEVEKELGFKSKKDIEAYGLDRFVNKCKERVLRYAAVQTNQSMRLGYWMDWNSPEHLRWMAERLIEDPAQVITVDGPEGPVTDTVEQIVGRLGLAELGGSYFTFSNENNYMIWTFLKKCWEHGWLYRGADVMPWCPRCATGISQHEIVTDGYSELTHDSVTFRMPLRGRPGESLLAWTTTPWTLTSNVAAAVGADLTYVRVGQGEEILYLSKGAIHMLRGKYEVLGELKGREMEGWSYDGPFDDLPAEQQPGGHTQLAELIRDVPQSAIQAHRILLWNEVGEAEGTGIVHIAPGCGAEDFVLGKEYHLPLVAPLNDEGYFVEDFGWLSGRHVSEVATGIFDDLRRKGLLYTVEPYTHRYPICWRCKTELVFRLVDEWFIRMDELRYRMIEVAKQIHWIPAFGLDRELDWLRNMHDWMISKKRYWGLALPFWECDACHHFEVIGDEQELQSRATAGWETFAGHTPHRPFIDAVQIACSKCGGAMSRIDEVGNPWLDAGIVPFSTLRYRTDRAYWEKWYSADWISESFPGQFRNWFYSLLAMATVIDNSPPFLENFGYSTLMAEDGRAMHKSSGNSIEFNEAADKMGVDVMRWLYCAHKPENNLLFGYHRADEVRRQFLIPLWNVYNFFVTYANLDGWQPDLAGFDPAQPAGATPQSDNTLDRWILARLNQVTASCTTALDASDFLSATGAVESFIDDLTNWYVRRNRRRFWKSEHDSDKNSAYATLHHVLVKLATTLAPITPFVTEVMYQNLVRSVYPAAYESIHHCAWPAADRAAIDENLLTQMELARRVANLGLSARGSANIKLRQPLARALVYTGDGLGGDGQRSYGRLSEALIEMLADELNVKSVDFASDEGSLVTYRLLPDNKLLGPKLGKLFPKVRAALSAADPAAIARQVQAGQPVTLQVEGETVTLAPAEVLVNTEPAAGLAVATDKGTTVAVDTVITAELRQEGLAREIVRRIQTMRKEAGFNVEDRITVYYVASGELAQTFADWGDYIRAETLATALLAQQPPAEAHTENQKVEGFDLMLGVKR